VVGESLECGAVSGCYEAASDTEGFKEGGVNGG
jgi:hypothetical protein